jgi:hypothetical protein
MNIFTYFQCLLFVFGTVLSFFHFQFFHKFTVGNPWLVPLAGAYEPQPPLCQGTRHVLRKLMYSVRGAFSQSLSRRDKGKKRLSLPGIESRSLSLGTALVVIQQRRVTKGHEAEELWHKASTPSLQINQQKRPLSCKRGKQIRHLS